jgi:hypothetical protein
MPKRADAVAHKDAVCVPVDVVTVLTANGVYSELPIPCNAVRAH